MQSIFLSTPSAWRATGGGNFPGQLFDISIHALRMEGDKSGASGRILLTISIHALRMEGDLLFHSYTNPLYKFLSTPSAWRATQRVFYCAFNHIISIHALRMEGDYDTFDSVEDSIVFLSTPSAWRATSGWSATTARHVFLSTPSAWRATNCVFFFSCNRLISIHALRMEGDYKLEETDKTIIISIHALRMEGDCHQFNCK